MSTAKPKTFESSLEELERIVRELEQGELPLERSLELFEQGVKLSRECQDRLNQAERRIEILMRDNQGRSSVRPFEPENSADDSAGEDSV
jgi:exodeoxyribonuclease VII small subunit